VNRSGVVGGLLSRFARGVPIVALEGRAARYGLGLFPATHPRYEEKSLIMATETWTPAPLPDLSGRTAVVTGASSRLGAVTARELARAGARVVLAVRDPAMRRRPAPSR
jgi:hypothetical protein